MSRSEAFQFRLPQQDLSALTFCKAGNDGMRAWIESLPRANLGQSTRALYDAINEVVRLKVSAQQRFDLLELLRTVIHGAVEGLSRHYLQQPVVLPEKPRKVAELAQAIATKDRKRMGGIKGIGPTTANRIVDEPAMQKWATGRVTPDDSQGAAPAPGVAAPEGVGADAVSALLNLWWKRPEAAAAVARAMQLLGEDAPLGNVIRDSLRELAPR